MLHKPRQTFCENPRVCVFLDIKTPSRLCSGQGGLSNTAWPYSIIGVRSCGDPVLYEVKKITKLYLLTTCKAA